MVDCKYCRDQLDIPVEETGAGSSAADIAGQLEYPIGSYWMAVNQNEKGKILLQHFLYKQ